jgi:hypothetical protein
MLKECRVQAMLPMTDMARARAFYAENLGLTWTPSTGSSTLALSWLPGSKTARAIPSASCSGHPSKPLGTAISADVAGNCLNRHNLDAFSVRGFDL